MSDQSGEHVHYYDDGRGWREVIIDGQPVSHVIWCDTKAGIAVVADQPLKSSDGETLDIHPVWGEVEVFFCGGYTQTSKTLPAGEGSIQ